MIIAAFWDRMLMLLLIFSGMSVAGMLGYFFAAVRGE